MLLAADVERICQGLHGDAFAVLGPHAQADGSVWLAAFQPGAAEVAALATDGTLLATLQQRDPAGLFEGALPAMQPYRLQVRWQDGNASSLDDPYRFGPVLGEMDAWLLGEGSHLRPFEILGAQPRTHEGVDGCSFAVWAPNAARVSVVGDFNHWDGRRHPMRLRRECGVWEIFVPGVGGCLTSRIMSSSQVQKSHGTSLSSKRPVRRSIVSVLRVAPNSVMNNASPVSDAIALSTAPSSNFGAVP